jgi:hypothetical protein
LRAYSEINDFEHDLWHAGGIVVKFWLQISDEEQLKRFEERAKIEHKRFKITEEDWRNREKAGAYHEAVCDMIDRTSSGTAPWTIVESNDKLFARIKVLRTICERLEKGTQGRADERAEGVDCKSAQGRGGEGGSGMSRRNTNTSRRSSMPSSRKPSGRMRREPRRRAAAERGESRRGRREGRPAL